MFLLPRNNNKTTAIYHILAATNKHFFSTSSLTCNKKCNNPYNLGQTQIPNRPFLPNRYVSFSWYYSPVATRALRKRIKKRFLAATKPVLDLSLFDRAISKLPPRFTPEDLHAVMALEDDPLVCLELFNWASSQHRFKHNEMTFHITIKRLGDAKMYEEMDGIVNLVLAVPSIGNEELYNSMISYLTQARKLVRAVAIFKRMKGNKRLCCRPTIATYKILFATFLNRSRKDSLVNHAYMDTTRCLFRQMVNDGIEPDIFTLNSMIKGYVLALHLNDALRIYSQMGVVYECLPDSFTYNYLIHGLCAQGRTQNARDFCFRMKKKGFIPGLKAYNSLVNALALGGEVDEAVKYLWEMFDIGRSVDFITYRTIIDELCRQKNDREAELFLEDLRGKGLIDQPTYRRLQHELSGNLPDNSRY